MKQLIILIDESADNSQREIGEVGTAQVYWACYLYDSKAVSVPALEHIPFDLRYEAELLTQRSLDDHIRPVTTGSLYRSTGTGTMICIEGIWQSLHQVAILVWTEKVDGVVVCGDCDDAFLLVEGRKMATSNRVRYFCDAIQQSVAGLAVPVQFRRVNNEYPLFAAVDAEVKRLRALGDGRMRRK